MAETDKLREIQAELADLIEALGKRTETSHAISAAAFVEDQLRRGIRSRLRHNLSKRQEQKLFEGYGPLSSFSVKIDMAFAIEVIDEKARHDLTIIKDIRNAFAHPKSGVTYFNSAEVLALLAKIPDDGAQRSAQLAFDLLVERCLKSLEKILEHDALVTALRGYASEHSVRLDQPVEEAT